jgi:hypothetical protein
MLSVFHILQRFGSVSWQPAPPREEAKAEDPVPEPEPNPDAETDPETEPTVDPDPDPTWGAAAGASAEDAVMASSASASDDGARAAGGWRLRSVGWWWCESFAHAGLMSMGWAISLTHWNREFWEEGWGGYYVGGAGWEG